MKNVVLLALSLIMPIASATAQAQTVGPSSIRPIPVDAKRADFKVLGDGLATLNGKPFRMSPAIQIRDTNNLIVLSQSISGDRYPARVQLDSDGSVYRVWLLTPNEAKKK